MYIAHFRDTPPNAIGEIRQHLWIEGELCGVSPFEFQIDGSYWEIADPSIIDPETGIPKDWPAPPSVYYLIVKIEWVEQDLVLMTAYNTDATVEYKRTDKPVSCP